jgi:DNA repair protein RecN (Recombination protein N)
MLTELRIRDLGIISAVDLVLPPGMTAVTGETGAGKTMLIGAINALLGAPVDASMVRGGAEAATIEGRFVVADTEMVLSRVIPAEGRSRAYVDGRLATAALLADLGAGAVEVHGQRTLESLLAPAVQRRALDRFGAVDREPLRAADARIQAATERLDELGGDARARAREIDLLRYQRDELARAGVADPDEDERLEAEEDLLAGAQAHRDSGARAHEMLVDDGGAIDILSAALAAVTGRTPFAVEADRLRALTAETADVAEELRRTGEAIADDPGRLDEVHQRRQLLRELRRKYGDTLADVIGHAEEVAARLDDLERYEARAAELEAERDLARAERAVAAAAIASRRRQQAPLLAAAVQSALRELAMPRVRVDVSAAGPDPADDVRFLLAANPGEPLLPLTKVASGGELARAMLALRLVLTEAPDTLIFDEVDAGVGGEAALAVGRALAAVGARHQVLVVTHLPQVAAFADHQVVVEKHEIDSRTEAGATTVTGEARTLELSRMLSGLTGSGSGRRHASELLKAARAEKAASVDEAAR